jgi:hypothetical protein
MTTPLPEPVAAELKRHKFSSTEAKEAMAARLLAVWKAMMQPKSSDAYVMLGRQHRKQARR